MNLYKKFFSINFVKLINILYLVKLILILEMFNAYSNPESNNEITQKEVNVNTPIRSSAYRAKRLSG